MAVETSGNAALFFDLGGTLVELDESRELPLDSSGKLVMKLLPGVAEKLRPIRDHLMFVITNQSKIKRGRCTLDQVEQLIHQLDRQLGDILTGYQICPHDDADGCECRKPKPGMIRDLAETYGVNLAASTVIGDQQVDELASKAAGVGRFVYARDFFGWK